MTRKNNIYTLLITFIAFRSVILSKFPTLYFPYKLSFYAWATCVYTPKREDEHLRQFYMGVPPGNYERPCLLVAL